MSLQSQFKYNLTSYVVFILFSETSVVEFVSPPDAIEDGVSEYSCSATGGVPPAASMMWFLDGDPVCECQNIPLDEPCSLVIQSSFHNRVLTCQEFQLDYLEGSSDDHTLDVYCM